MLLLKRVIVLITSTACVLAAVASSSGAAYADGVVPASAASPVPAALPVDQVVAALASDPDLAALASAFAGQPLGTPEVGLVGGAQFNDALQQLLDASPIALAAQLGLSVTETTNRLGALRARSGTLPRFDDAPVYQVAIAGPDPIAFILGVVGIVGGCVPAAVGALPGFALCAVGVTASLLPVVCDSAAECELPVNTPTTQCTQTFYSSCSSEVYIHDPEFRIASISDLTSCLTMTGVGAGAASQKGTFCVGPYYGTYYGNNDVGCRLMYNTIPPRYGHYCMYRLANRTSNFGPYNCAYAAEGWFYGRFTSNGQFFQTQKSATNGPYNPQRCGT